MKTIALVGAGLVGSLLSIFLARRGVKVDIFERRPDMRREAISAGRSINLAISVRGIHALEKLGLDRQILSSAVPMRGRMIHGVSGDLTFQLYGMDERDCINSISRATLNKELMTAAEGTGKVEIFFNQKAQDIDFSTGTLTLADERSGLSQSRQYDMVIGTDGSASAIRHAMMKLDGFTSTETALDYGYKELAILPGSDGGFKLERNALHIWPRGNFMLIALPNFEGSFTCTLFLPWKGDVSFEKLTDVPAVEQFFNEFFPDAVPLIDNLTDAFTTNPTGHMVTVKTYPWNVGGRCLLVGDAAHGIVPFYGQGMNCGFEDCTIFDGMLSSADNIETVDWETIFGRMSSVRKADTDAIADMAVENFVEMRDKVADKKFLLGKAVDKVLEKKFPGRYVSRYSMVTFTNVPYSFSMKAGAVCDSILSELTADIDSADQVDLAKAERLVDERLAPMLVPLRHLLTRFTEEGTVKI